MRTNARTILIALMAAAVLLAVASCASARSSAQYRIEGRGWGHGIGMSQYGADGYAKQGMTGERIIQHYFTGTVVAPRPANGPTDLRVLLQSYLSPARIEVTSRALVRQGIATASLPPACSWLPCAFEQASTMRSCRRRRQPT